MLKDYYFKYRIYIIPSAVGLVCLLIIGFVIVPQMLEIFKERESSGVLFNRIDLLNKKANELNAIDDTKLQQNLVTALTVMPTDRDVPQAMAVLQDLISKSNLSLKSTSYAAGSKTSGQNSFQLTISVLGPLDSARSFLNSLREAPRIYQVDSIGLRFQPEGSLVSLDLPLTVFYQPAPATVLSVDQPVAKIDVKQEDLIANLIKVAAQKEVFATSSAVPIGKEDPFQ
ncbi:MAG: hypothetical protein WCV81_03650 [Microgenomates group bacterium]|jgi:hypothetical protein